MTESTLTYAQTSTVETMARLISGYRVTGIICAAAQLGIADHVGADGAPADELARATECDVDAVRRLMRALASVGVFAETAPGTFVHTELSTLLKRGAEPSLHGLAAMTALIDLHTWPHIAHSLKTGQPAFDGVFGAGIFEYMKCHDDVREAFDRAMAGYTEVVADAVLNAYDFGRYRTIVDIGGGNGSFLRRIISKYPRVHGTIYDLEQAVTRALSSMAGTPWESHIDGVAGNFLEWVPSGADLYTIKIVLCDWRDDQVVRILSNVHRAIGDGRLLIVDAILPAGNAPSFAKLSDINMLVTTGSRERSEEDFCELLARSGFAVTAVARAHEWVGLIEACRRQGTQD